MSDLIFDGLNDEQRRAVEAINGPVLILAGAGSGKTRALTHRIAYLISRGIPAWQILSVTFTNKAANEMKERITKLLHTTDVASQLPAMGTFHSICVRILRRDIEHIGRNRDFVIYDTSDQETLMKNVMKDLGIDPKEIKPKTALSHISKLKSEAIRAEDVVRDTSSEWMMKIIKLYTEYNKRLLKHNALDFDDLLTEVIRLFTERPDILERYQNTWKYINIDEYQDTNHAQYTIVSLLAKKHHNLCVIGDPDQSIYAFRGADIRNILEFQQEYPKAQAIKLERNYRSTQQILDASDAVISVNPNRPQKKMWTERVDGEKILVHEVRDEKDEAKEVVDSAVRMMAQGKKLNDQAVLYRTNAQSRLLEEACMKRGVPYRIIGGVKFYARREVKDVLAYLYAIHNPNDALSLLRIINIPSRKIGKTTIEKIQDYCHTMNIDVWDALKNVIEIPTLSDAVQKRITEFVHLIESYRPKRERMVVSELAKNLLNDLKMEKWIRDDTTEGEERWQNIGELLTVMKKYDNTEPLQSFTSFLEEVALVSEVDKLDELRNDALTLMTLHLCKGLEFDHVMIVGCEEGIFPHSNTQYDREQLEEERRLMYVGMTRAKDKLCIFHARSRMLWGDTQANERSRFIDDIPQSIAEWKSEEFLSANVWSSFGNKRGVATSTNESFSFGRSTPQGNAPRKKITSFKQHHKIDMEFNQDVFDSDYNQDETSLDDFTPGTRVKHPVFGEGVIDSLTGDIAEIHFDSGTMKKMALNIAPIEIIEEVAEEATE